MCEIWQVKVSWDFWYHHHSIPYTYAVSPDRIFANAQESDQGRLNIDHSSRTLGAMQIICYVDIWYGSDKFMVGEDRGMSFVVLIQSVKIALGYSNKPIVYILDQG